MENLAMSVVCATASPDEILQYLSENKGAAGLYFLDLDLGCGINGITLAEGIRIHDPRGFIVFITADGESFKLTFEHHIEAMDYIVKGDINLKERICECIQNAQAKLAARPTQLQDKFAFKLAQDADGLRGTFKLAKDSIVSIDSTDIMYFEISPETKHTILIFTTDGRFEFRGSLSQIEGEMDKKRFFRCQRNLIVNLAKVVAVDVVQLNILFENGLLVDIGAKQAMKLAARVRDYAVKFP
jgi:two-component system response regulator AgrA